MLIDRHQIVRLVPGAWPAVVEAHPVLKALPAARDWAAFGRPLIARRTASGDGEGMVPLGLPLPPSLGKQRLVISVPPEWVMASDNPPLLSDAMTVAPAAWKKTIAELVEVDGDVRCFGSLAWEYLTGLRYLSDTSDLDLIWHVSTKDGADGLVVKIAPIEADAPFRIDGEVICPGGLAIQWREWASAAPELLAKAWDGNRLVTRASVLP
jgi:phosphoribosyl-dephospho-CoA transferase